jgi:hypothetical protein
MKRRGLVIALCLLAASTGSAQTKTPVEGVWKIAEVIFPDTSPFGKPGAARTNIIHSRVSSSSREGITAA